MPFTDIALEHTMSVGNIDRTSITFTMQFYNEVDMGAVQRALEGVRRGMSDAELFRALADAIDLGPPVGLDDIVQVPPPAPATTRRKSDGKRELELD